MISRYEFPYLQSLLINDAYAVKNLTVPVFQDGEEFKHLILTGRNGSGKTTVLQSLAAIIQFDVSSKDKHPYQIKNLENWISGSTDLARLQQYSHELKLLKAVRPSFWPKRPIPPHLQPYASLSQASLPYENFPTLKGTLVAFFSAYRKIEAQPVAAPAKEDSYVASLEKPQGFAEFAAFFKQYLVNKKVTQALAQIEGNDIKAQEGQLFFKKFEHILRDLFDDKELTLDFVSEEYEFYLQYKDGRRITFNQLSVGFSAFLNIVTDLLMRVDLLRKQANDYTYDPCGFVLIDEPETHLHLEMQYQILPLLTDLFPNLQFIVATHSPAVASSITGATVFDLSTGKALGDVAAGSSYSELMQGHFGVENEFSNVADVIIADIRRIVRVPDPVQARRQLLDLLADKGRYMSATLRLEVEAQLIGLE